MKVVLNGSNVEVSGTPTVAELLEVRGLAGAPRAVEVNAELVTKARHADHRIAEGDRIEIVTLVGGG